MFRYPATTLRAAAIAITALLATTAAVPAGAQFSVSISYDNFHNRLAPYGTWSNNARWGEVWQPRADRGFRPYYDGHWVDTREYGYTWVSNESWGDVPYHYGRWVFEPGDGWLWVPGYVWGPSWVVWRSGGGNIGWFPMPPNDNYYGDGAYHDNFDNQYGYRDLYGPSFGNDQFLSLWIFVGQDHFRDRDYRNYAVPQRDYGRFISQTTNTTNYITVNNYVVNRSIDESRFPRDGNQRFAPVAASTVIGRDALATQANLGRQVEQQERQKRPIPVNINPAEPRGRGNFNSNAQQQNQNRGQQGPGNREPGAAFVDPSARTAPGPTPDTSKQNGRGQANINPNEQRGRGNGNSNAQQPNQTPQAAPAVDTSRQNDRGQANVNPNEQGGRGNGNSNAQQPNANQAPQNLGSRGGDRGSNTKGADQSNLQTQRNAPLTLAPPADRGAATFQSPRTREAPEQNGKAVVQDARPPARVPAEGPAAAAAVDNQGSARNNQARGNRQGDGKNADDQKAADEKKNGADRGRN